MVLVHSGALAFVVGNDTFVWFVASQIDPPPKGKKLKADGHTQQKLNVKWWLTVKSICAIIWFQVYKRCVSTLLTVNSALNTVCCAVMRNTRKFRKSSLFYLENPWYSFLRGRKSMVFDSAQWLSSKKVWWNILRTTP